MRGVPSIANTASFGTNMSPCFREYQKGLTDRQMPMPSKEATSQGGVGCPGRGSLRPPVSALGVAASRDSREVGVSAERAETAGWIGYADHRQRARFVLAIKGCGLGHVEAACGGVLGIIEPEADVKRIGRRQGD